MHTPKLNLLVPLFVAALLLPSCALHTRTPVIAVGQPAPDFALPDADGRYWELSKIVANGSAVVVFYRGYW